MTDINFSTDIGNSLIYYIIYGKVYKSQGTDANN